MFTICRNFNWMKNWIYITILSEKFANQCMEQTNSKVPSKHFTIMQGLITNMAVSLWNFYSLVCKFNVCFIRLENLVYQNNPFIIYTIGQSSMHHITLNQLNITKQIFLHIYHFPSTLVLLKYQDPL